MPPIPQAAKTSPKRQPLVPTPSSWSAYGTDSDMNPAPDSERRKPTIVCDRTPRWPQRKRSPSPTSVTSTRGRSGGPPVRRSDSRVRMPATQTAESANETASNPSSHAGWTKASSRPASIGMPRSRSEPTPHTAEFASPMRSRPTIAGSAPKAAPSKKTNAAWLRNPAARACHGVRTPSHHASGTDAMTRAATRSATTMTRRRSSRSDSAPEKSPSMR